MAPASPATITSAIPVFDNLEALFQSGFGSCREFFFSDNKDWSKVIVMFNGAVSSSQRANGFCFQRWSWVQKFKHPVVIIADPITFGDDGLSLGWYVGFRDDYYLPFALEKILPFIRERNLDSKVITFGSSAGGFTALAALQLGYADMAIAINPQTDIEAYSFRAAVQSMLRRYMRTGVYGAQDVDRARFSLMEMGLSKAKKHARIIYVQNSADTHHHDEHMQPYFCCLKESGLEVGLVSAVFNDEKLGHNPPLLNGLVRLIGQDLQCMLV